MGNYAICYHLILRKTGTYRKRTSFKEYHYSCRYVVVRDRLPTELEPHFTQEAFCLQRCLLARIIFKVFWARVASYNFNLAYSLQYKTILAYIENVILMPDQCGLANIKNKKWRVTSPLSRCVCMCVCWRVCECAGAGSRRQVHLQILEVRRGRVEQPDALLLLSLLRHLEQRVGC